MHHHVVIVSPRARKDTRSRCNYDHLLMHTRCACTSASAEDGLKDADPKDAEPKDEEPNKDEEPEDEEPKGAEPEDEELEDEEPEGEEPEDVEPKDEELEGEEPEDEEPEGEEPKGAEPKAEELEDEEPEDEEALAPEEPKDEEPQRKRRGGEAVKMTFAGRLCPESQEKKSFHLAMRASYFKHVDILKAEGMKAWGGDKGFWKIVAGFYQELPCVDSPSCMLERIEKASGMWMELVRESASRG